MLSKSYIRPIGTLKFVLASMAAVLLLLLGLATQALAQDVPTPVPTDVVPVSIPAPENTATPLPPAPAETPAPPAVTPAPPAPVAPAAPPTAQPPQPAQPVQPVQPVVNNYAGLWIAELTKQSAVRSGAASTTKAVKTWWAGRRVLLYQAVADGKGGYWYRVSDPPEAPMYVHSSVVRRVAAVRYESAMFAGRWINVNVTQQVVTAYQGGVPVKVTLASTGTSKNPTNLGITKIMWRLTKRDMKGGSKAAGDYYDLKNVPYPQYFNSTGEALHGTYWHDDFGRPHSHGCVNLSTPISQWFYGWASVGTPVYLHR